jgi:hypothetical protein
MSEAGQLHTDSESPLRVFGRASVETGGFFAEGWAEISDSTVPLTIFPQEVQTFFDHTAWICMMTVVNYI